MFAATWFREWACSDEFRVWIVKKKKSPRNFWILAERIKKSEILLDLPWKIHNLMTLINSTSAKLLPEQELV